MTCILFDISFLKHVTEKHPGRRSCNYNQDRTFVCTITTGQIEWQPKYAGKFCCTASTDDVLTVYAIEPGMY